MKKEEIRLRLGRVVDGSRNVEDLNRLFNWLRFNSHGNETVAELGHFAAHQNKRERGITWKRASDMFHNARLALAIVRAEAGDQIEISRKQLFRSLNASLDLIGPARVKADLRVGTKKAREVIAEAVEVHPSRWSPRLVEVCNYLGQRFTSQPVFTQESLMDSLIEVLRREGLLSPDGLDALRSQAGFISIYAISIMHLCQVDLGDEEVAHLEACVDRHGMLGIGARIDNVIGTIGIGLPLFTTECAASDWFEGPSDAPWDSIFTWRSPLEVSASGLLKELN